MLDINTLLDIKYYNGSTYADLNMKMGSGGRDTYSVTLADTDYLYIGFQKPIRNIYFDFTTPNTNANTLTIEYYNDDDTWTALSDIYDETEGFTRSGLIQWAELAGTAQDDVAVDSVTKFWIRIQPSVAHSASVWNFIGLILANDSDLELENPYILETNLLMGESNHLKAHLAARKEIVQTYSNKGNRKVDQSLNHQRLDFWDMLDIQEFRQGAVFLALSKIYFNLSDKEEDTWLSKSKEYRQRYLEQVNLYYTTLDKNDNGLTSASEKSGGAAAKTISR